MISLSIRRLLHRAWICALVLPITVGLPVWADDGLFEVTRGSLRVDDAQYLLDGQVDLQLNSEAAEALESGLMLSIQMQFEITRQRRFWTDIQVASASRDFELRFKALSQRYLVTDNLTGEQQSYATLPSALRNLGRISTSKPHLAQARRYSPRGTEYYDQVQRILVYGGEHGVGI